MEDNTIVGNVHGLFLTAGPQDNIIRRNLIMGNPPVQLELGSDSKSGYDIRNLAAAGTNVFSGNVCQTAINAPCPANETLFKADPNPIPVSGGDSRGQTTIRWSAPGAQAVEIHVGSPDGPVFVLEGNRGTAQTGRWVSDGMTLYLQDVSDGKPATPDYTLATLTLRLQK